MTKIIKCGYSSGKMRVRLRKNNLLWFHGIDFGKRLEIIYENDPICICKRPGYVGWAGFGQQTYYPTRYYLLVKSNEDTYTIIAEGEFGKQWKKAIPSLLEYYEQNIGELPESGNGSVC